MVGKQQLFLSSKPHEKDSTITTLSTTDEESLFESQREKWGPAEKVKKKTPIKLFLVQLILKIYSACSLYHFQLDMNGLYL